MPKLKGVDDANGKRVGYRFYCPGCEHNHSFSDQPGGWQFDGNMVLPTVTPSLLTTGSADPNYRCHLYLTAGKIRYLTDCSHALAGKTIELPDLDEEWT